MRVGAGKGRSGGAEEYVIYLLEQGDPQDDESSKVEKVKVFSENTKTKTDFSSGHFFPHLMPHIPHTSPPSPIPPPFFLWEGGGAYHE